MKKKALALICMMTLALSATACGKNENPSQTPSMIESEQSTENTKDTENTEQSELPEGTSEENLNSTETEESTEKTEEERTFVAIIDYIDDSGITFHPQDKNDPLYEIAESFYVPASATTVIRDNGNLSVYDVVYFYDGVEIKYTKEPKKGKTGIFSSATVVLSEKYKLLADDNTSNEEIDETPIVVVNNDSLKANQTIDETFCKFEIPGEIANSIAYKSTVSGPKTTISIFYTGEKYKTAIGSKPLIEINSETLNSEKTIEESTTLHIIKTVLSSNEASTTYYYIVIPTYSHENPDVTKFVETLQAKLQTSIMDTISLYE